MRNRMGPMHAGEGQVTVGRTNMHARRAGQANIACAIAYKQPLSIYAYESGECPSCAHTVNKNNTLTHTRPPRLNKWFLIYAYEIRECPACAHTVHKNNTLTHTRPPRLNKWFHIIPSFVCLLAACSLPEFSLHTFIYDQTVLLCVMLF